MAASTTDDVDQSTETADKMSSSKRDRRDSEAVTKSGSMRARLMGKAKSVASGIIADTGVLKARRRSSAALPSMLGGFFRSCMARERGKVDLAGQGARYIQASSDLVQA